MKNNFANCWRVAIFRLKNYSRHGQFRSLPLACVRTDRHRIVNRSRRHGLFLRDVSGMGRCLGQHVLRIAVKDAATNVRMIAILSQELGLDAVAFIGLDLRHAETI
jgi:histidinol-phosphate/aromatic aminotransferase/cobyric acid decarboxylase-like protein